MKKKLFVAGLIMIMALSMFSCGSSDSGEASGGSEGGNVDTFIVRSIGDPASFNPDGAADDNLFPIAQNMYRRLVALDTTKGSVVGEAAEEWSYNEDATELTFNLRDDLVWSDGEPLTSEDVKYTFEAIAENPLATFSANMSVVSSIETPDDYTVVFKLTQPDMSFLNLLGWYGTFILPEHVWNNGEAWEDNAAAEEPVTCGPFKFDSHESGESVTLVADENYPDGSTVSRLIFSIIPDEATAVQALQNGEIDFMENLPAAYYEDMQSDENINIFLNAYPSPIKMVFNFENEDLAKQEVRTAIAKAIDRDEISEKVFSGIQEPEYNMYPSSIEWATNSDAPAPDMDVEGARALLEEAGYTEDADGFYIRGMELSVFEGSGYPDSANLLKAQLEKIGIEVTVQVSEYNAWESKVTVNHDFDITLIGGFMGPDPSGMASRICTGQASNVGSYSNAEVDELMAKGKEGPTQEDSAEYYKEAQAIIAEELPYVPIVEFVGPDAYGSQYENLPSDGAGKWSWADFSHVTMK